MFSGLATVIPFKQPSIGPCSEEEEDVFSELEHVVMSGMMSSMIGWAIQQGKAVEAQQEREEVVAIIESTRSLPRKEHAELGLLLFFSRRFTFIFQSLYLVVFMTY